MKIHKTFISIFLFIIHIQPQSEKFNFQNLTIENGLSSNRITSIIQDSKGFIWIGTEDGLNRFDGYSFSIYKNKRGNKNSLSNNYIWSLSEDKNGNIWIATNGGGLNKYDPVYQKFYHYRHNADDTSSLSMDIVKCVYIDKQNNLWAGTWGGGINLFDPENNSFTRFKNNPDDPGSISSNKIWCIYEDSKSNLWIGTSEGGLNLFDRKKKEFKSFIHDKYSNSFSGTSAVTICEDSKGNLWIGTHGNGVDRYNFKTETFTNFRANNTAGSISGNIIWKILEDNQGLVWIATQGSGFNFYNYDKNKFKQVVLDPQNPNDFSANNVKDLFEDRSSVLWIGMFAGGIKKIDRKLPKFATIKKIPDNPNSLPENFVYTMCEDNFGDIWIGTYSNLTLYSPLKNLFKIYPVNLPGKNAVSGKRVRYIYEDSRNEIWIGTYYGKLNKYDRKTDTFIKYNLDIQNVNSGQSNVRVIFEDSENLLWFGTNGNGLIRYDRTTEDYKIYNTKTSKISGDIVLTIVEDDDNILWIGTFGRGLNKFNRQTESFIHFMSSEEDPSSLSDNSVTELFIDSRRNLWVGTFSGGLCRFNYQENNFEIHTEEDGLSGNYIAGMLEDEKQNLWISTSKGISKLSSENISTPHKGKAGDLFKNYDFTHGLQKGEFMPAAKLKTSSDYLYFGGVNGINYFHPDSLTGNLLIPPVAITSFKINNVEVDLEKNISYTDTIYLNYNENNFSFEFASLDFTFSDRNKYAYLLEGLEESWNYTDNRRYANYTHLDPGDYKFRVKGTNNEGVWNEKGVSVTLIIEPPFWSTWWFRSVMFLSIAGGVVFIYKSRINKLEKEKAAQEEFAKRLISSQEEERKRIASELHDSLGQDLLIIKNLAVLGLKKNDKEFLIKNLEDISLTTSATIEEVRQISYNLHPYQLDRLGLTKAVKSIITQIGSLTKINFKESIENIDDLFSKDDEINIYRIVQECINNIVKHSEAAEAEIIILVEDNNLIVKISDNGKGFEPAKVEFDNTGFGMKNLEKRIKILGGEKIISSSPGKGTSILIKVLISRKNGKDN